MITKEKFREAMAIVEKYHSQIKNKTTESITTPECRVKLSEWGIKMQGKRKEKLTGTVLDYLPWVVNPETDGSVTVQWDSRTTPESMHISQIELLK